MKKMKKKGSNRIGKQESRFTLTQRVARWGSQFVFGYIHIYREIRSEYLN